MNFLNITTHFLLRILLMNSLASYYHLTQGIVQVHGLKSWSLMNTCTLPECVIESRLNAQVSPNLSSSYI